MPELILKPERERSLLRGHPWVFSGAIGSIKGTPAMGETVKVLDHKHQFLASAAYSPLSQIRARVWSFVENEAIDEKFFSTQIQKALDLRTSEGFLPFAPEQYTAARLIHGESDGLPGLIVDRYNDTLVAQFLSAGPDRWKNTIAKTLIELSGCAGVYERSDAEVRGLEQLPEINAPLLGTPNEQETIYEHGISYQVDIASGHKTGFYLDQRVNRAMVLKDAKGKEVLNCFCYTGGFSLAAMKGGALKVTSIDSSAPAVEIAKNNARQNGFEANEQEWIVDNVFTKLREFRDRGLSFDLIILDPPKFAANAGQVRKASRAYKDINLLGLKLLKPGGCLYTFSCSGGIDEDLFQKIVAGADLDARSDAVIVRRTHQSGDHPIKLSFPEGAYLKGLVLRKRS